MEVKVYSTKTCPYCKMAKDFLKSNGIEFEEFDVGSDEKARHEMMHASGQMGVPVILVDGQVVIGNDTERMRELLGIQDV